MGHPEQNYLFQFNFQLYVTTKIIIKVNIENYRKETIKCPSDKNKVKVGRINSFNSRKLSQDHV